MKINSIIHLRNCGVFHKFQWRDSNELPDFSDFNLIYGWNGTGKSTISRIFRSLQLGQPITDSAISLMIDDRPVSGSEFGERSLSKTSVRVFNQDFVKATVFRDDGGEIAPIVVVGDRNVEALEQIKALRSKRDLAATDLAQAQKFETDSDNRLDNHSPEQAKEIKLKLGDRGDHFYQNYDRRNYERRADQMRRADDADSHILTDVDRTRLDELQRERLRDPIGDFADLEIDIEALAVRTTALLDRTAVSAAAIDVLLNNSALSEWIHRGLALHDDLSSSECLFCAQHLPPDRMAELRAHFNDAYDRLMADITSTVADLNRVAERVSKLSDQMPKTKEFYDDLSGEYEAAKAKAKTYLDQLEKSAKSQVDALLTKQQQSIHASMPGNFPAVSSNPLSAVKAIIEQHNRRTDAFENQVQDARRQLEADFVARHLPAYTQIVNARDNARADKSAAEAQIASIDVQIDTLEAEIRSHRPAADDLNRDMQQYLGHDQFKLRAEENGYVILRDGVPAEDPSEGEMTAIALLYFLRSLNGDEFDLDNGIVVLDDPVSSLDSNALYIAAGYIRTRTRDAGQLFILTHNFGFFREMKNWFGYLNWRNRDKARNDPAHFYMLDAFVRDGRRQSSIRPLDSLLRNYESDYHYLFSCVYRAAKQSTPERGLEANYGLPNIARRLVESFLAFKQPRAARMWTKLEELDFEPAAKARIGRFLDVHSHQDTIDGTVFDPVPLAESGAVLQDVLRLIKAVDEDHYLAMVELCEQQDNQ